MKRNEDNVDRSWAAERDDADEDWIKEADLVETNKNNSVDIEGS